MLKRISFLIPFLILLFFAETTKAQLVVDPNYTLNTLVNQTMLGFGASVTNVTYTGSNTSVGFFNATSTNLNLDSGIVMCTGDIVNAIGPNNAGTVGTNLNLLGDADLTAISGNATNDAAVLTLDFQALGDTFSFNFVFGSEEYPEFANSNFNDVFAFLITGPKPGGGTYNNENIALLPGTTTPVTINNVNATNNPQYYVDNAGGATIQYDAFTVVLEATAGVIPDSTYSLKIAIADVFDGAYDSGVFLQKNCEYEPDFLSTNTDDTLHISCKDSVVTMLMNQFINCNSLATDGSDFIIVNQVGDTMDIVTGATSDNCQNGFGISGNVDLLITPEILNWGVYYILPQNGSDGNTIFTACDNAILMEVNDTIILKVEDFCYNLYPDLLNVSVEDDDSVSVLWHLPVDPIYGDEWQQVFSSYDVYRSLDPLGPFTYLASGNNVLDTTYVDTATLVDQEAYNYNVRVIFLDGSDSNVSDSIQSILLTEDLNIPVDTNKLFLTWTEYWGWSNPTYRILHRHDEGPWEEVGTTNATSYEYDRVIDQEGVYDVKVETESSNKVAESNWLQYETIIYDPFITNVMTPDGDGINDEFLIRNLHQHPNTILKIYNRWGKKIYDTENYQNDWDGENYKAGTYYYTVEFRGSIPSKQSGNFIIIR